MSPKEHTAFRIATELMEAMRRVKATEGLPLAVQVDFSLREWLKARGVKVKAASRRSVKRRKATGKLTRGARGSPRS